MSTLLKEEEKCDDIICLSRLGYKYETNKVLNMILASEKQHIELILGGYTQTFRDALNVTKNKLSLDVTVTQVGWD